MNKIKLLHAADFHLDAPLSALGDNAAVRKQELRTTFGKVIDLAKSEGVDMVLLAGDILDSSDVSETTKKYMQYKFEEIAEIPVFIALGNHDYFLHWELPKNVHVFSDKIEKISFSDADIYGVSFSGQYCPACNLTGFQAENPDRINLFVLHGDIVGNGQSSGYNPVTPAALVETGIDYFALGHVHSYSGIQRINNTTYAYPGIPEGRGFDELGKKGVILAEVSKETVEARFVPVCQRQCIEIQTDITGCTDYAEIVNRITAIATERQDLYKILLTGETDMPIDIPLLSSMMNNGYFYTKFVDNTKPKLDLDALSQEHNLRGLFVKQVNGNDRALQYGLAALNGEKVPLP